MTVQEISQLSSLSDGAMALVQPDSTPPTYLDSLEKQELYPDAIRFLVYKLPTDAGIKWAARCVREMQPPPKDQKDEPLDAADNWIKAPADNTRWAAKETADKAKDAGLSKLVAMGVFMSGGSLSPPGGPEALPPAYSAQKFIVGSLLGAVISSDPKNSKARYQKALAMGKELDVPGK